MVWLSPNDGQHVAELESIQMILIKYSLCRKSSWKGMGHLLVLPPSTPAGAFEMGKGNFGRLSAGPCQVGSTWE